MITLGITGATGKMGREIISIARLDPKISSILGCANLDTTIDSVPVFSDIDRLSSCDIIIDFSMHSLIPKILETSLTNKIPLVIGTTGFTDSEKELIVSASKMIPILLSPNMSIGVNIFTLLLEFASKYLDTHNAGVIDIHHKNKLDSPSGTAKLLASISNIPLDKIASIRVGDVIGEHSVIFGLEKETITLTHSALDRSIFASGSVKAMHWLLDKPAGLYTMRDLFL